MRIVALRNKKEISMKCIKYINVLKLKMKLKKQTKTTNLKLFTIFDGSMPLKPEAPVMLTEDSEVECDVKEIFKNVLYRNKSNISMDTLDTSTDCEYKYYSLSISNFIRLLSKQYKDWS